MQYLDKGNIGQFPQKSSFSAIGQFKPKLCNLMSQAIRSHDMLFEKFEIFYYDGIQYLDQSNVCQFSQKRLFDARVTDLIWAKIIQPYLS